MVSVERGSETDRILDTQQLNTLSEWDSRMSTMTYDNFVDDDFELDASDIGEGELSRGGFIDKEGFFHVEILDATKEVDPAKGKAPCLRVDMKVLDGTDKSQVGRMLFHRINLAKLNQKTGELEPLSVGARKNLFKFFVQLGLLEQSQVEGNQSVKLPWQKLQAMQCVIEIKNEPYDETDKNTGTPTGKKKDSFRIPYGCNVWTVDAEKVKNVPKDVDALASFTGGAGIGDVSDI